MTEKKLALIVGAGSGLSAAIARRCAREGLSVVLAARRPEKLAALAAEIGARVETCDAAEAESVARLFSALDSAAPLDLAVYNPSYRVRGPLIELASAEVAKTLAVTAFGGFLVGQQAAKRMLARGRGTILFTGASASVKGYAQSAPFAMGKFALRGLAQSMARELQPKGIHIAHIVIDGGIGRDPQGGAQLDPDAIAETYWQLYAQDRSTWSQEVELRPWVEKF